MKVLRPGRPPTPTEPPKPVQMECRACEALLEWEMAEMRHTPKSVAPGLRDRGWLYAICPECDGAILFPGGQCVRRSDLGV